MHHTLGRGEGFTPKHRLMRQHFKGTIWVVVIMTLLFMKTRLSGQSAIDAITFTWVDVNNSANDYSATSPNNAGQDIDANTTYSIQFSSTNTTENNRRLNSFTVGGTSYAFLLDPDTLALRRVGTATRLSLWMEAESIDNTNDILILNPERQVPEESLYLASLLNIGYDNVLVNSGTNSSNIERIDAIFRTGMLTETPANALIPVLDRGANAEFKIAAILSLDANGDPATFGSLVEVNAGDSGGQVLSIGSSVLFLQQSLGQDPIPTGSSTQGVGGVAISLQELGVAANEIIFGYSLFSVDVNAVDHDLADISTFPTNSNNSGLDFGAGAVSAVSSDGNLVKATGPGGYKSALTTWLKANEGVTTATDAATVTDWQDQSLADHDAVTLETAPVYRDGTASGLEDINFNPTVDYLDASETGLQIANNSDFNVGGAPYTNKSFNIAIRTGNNITIKQQIYEQGDDTRGIDMFIESGNLVVTAYNTADDSGSGVSSPWNNGMTTTTISTALATETEYIITFEMDGSASGSGTITAYLNGRSFGNFGSVGQLADHSDQIGLGDFNSQSIVTTPAECPVPASGGIESESGIGNSGNITGQPDGAFAEVYADGDIITLDFGEEYPSGTEYEITWRRRVGQSGSAIPIIRESTLSDVSVNTQVTPLSTTSETFQTDVIVSSQAFRYLQITKEDAITGSITDFDLDAIVVDCTTEDITFNQGDAASFYGSIPEFIYCSEPSSFPLSQRQRIESYLALKYGITLDQNSPINYVNSEGDIIFNTTNAASIGGYLEYNSDIAGIGRDDASEFIQTQSQSENNNSLVRINRSAGFGVDDTWLIWGNDGASATTTNSSDKPPLISSRINRVWRVAEEGSVGETDISFDITDLGFGTDPADFSLLVAGNTTNGVFSSAGITTGATTSVIDGRTFLTFSNIDLADGEYFTLGTGFASCGPGGVTTNLDFWVRADLGTSSTTDNTEVSTWSDQAGSNDAVVANLGGGAPENPTLQTGEINFNPVIRFTDPGNTNSAFYSFTRPNAGVDFALIAVYSSNQNDSGVDSDEAPTLIGASAGAGNGTDDWSLGYADSRVHFKADQGNNGFSARSSAGIDYTDGTPRLLTGNRITGSNPDGFLYVDSEQVDTDGSNDSDLGQATLAGIGNHGATNANTASQLAGDVAEVIVYSDDLSSENRNLVESYLAIKYGITRNADDDGATGSVDERDYRRSDGTVVWDFSDQSSNYNNDIAGIGRDDDACLNQKQSSSVESTAIVSIGLGSIAATNNDNSNSFDTNGDFMVWGHDGTAASTTQTNDVPGTVTERLSRIWHVEETGTVGNTQLSFDITGLGLSGNASDFQLIISGTNTMASGNTFSGGTLNGNILTFDNVNFSDGDFFTLGVARTTCGPGGVTTSLALWLRADAGTNTTTNGEAVTSWIDQSTNSNNAAEDNAGGGAPVEPFYVTEDINFNPAIRFTNSENTNNSWLETSSNTSAQNLSLISVFKTAQSDGSATDFTESPAIISAETGAATDDYALGVSEGRLYVNAANDNGFSVRPVTSYNDNTARIATATRVDAVNGTGINLYVNSENVGSAASDGTDLDAAGTFAIGNHSGYDADAQYDGDIAEVIVFDQVLSETDQAQVESYLAIKYGITRSVSGLSETAEDYRASDSGVIWDIDNQGVTYHNDIFGIGRDDNGCFLQEKSKSINSDALVTFEVDDALSSDDAYLISGNDNAVLEQAGNPERPASIDSRLNREWRVQETGNVDNISLIYDMSTITGPLGVGTNNLNLLRLLVDDDGDFSTNASIISPSSIDNINNTVTFTVNFTDGQYYTLGSTESAALPVTLISFEAEVNEDNQVQLNWTTADETNNAFFSIERSRDGIDFETLAQIEGVGNSQELKDYLFIDTEPFEGQSFYRLKQTDFNGEFEHSGLRRINIKGREQLTFKVYPNPVALGEQLNIEYHSNREQEVKIDMVNINGISKWSAKVTLRAGSQSLSLPTSGLSRGLNLLRIIDTNRRVVTLKVIVR